MGDAHVDQLEREIARIHRSTRTRFRRLLPVHNWLRLRFRWYYRWHLHPYHRHVHYLATGVASGIAIALVVLAALPTPVIYATGSAVPLDVASTATIVNSGEKIFFDSDTNHTNVTIDNYSRQLAGYAWSNNLGWVAFGGGADNPQGPVTADAAGHLSGEAKFLNGGYLDFNASPSGANVTISAGVFSGYAWSEDLGWVNFTGVSVPQYQPDLMAPDNPGTVTAKSAAGGSALTSGSWYNFPAPYFSWSAPADHADTITPSGVAGYDVYFGQTGGTDPSSYQTGTTFTAPNLGTAYGTYYFRVKTVDAAGNVSAPVTLFTYKYEDAAPTAPAYVSATPSGYSRTNTFTFSWPVSGAEAATDTGGSDLARYQYKINGEATWHDVAGNGLTPNVTLSGIASTSVNTFDLRVLDAAGNASPSVRTNFYFNNAAPTAPRNLTVTPTSATDNAFAFSWEAPPGEIAGYYYSVNALPTASNANFTTATSLPAGPYATQQGENTLYVVAKDSAGNYDFGSCGSISGNPAVDGCAKVAFSATTAAPGIPGALQAYDISDRDAKDYAAAVKWTAPVATGSGFAGYDVYRSLDGTGFTKIGSTTSTIYADGGLESKAYYYYVVAKDNAGQFSAHTPTVSVTPTGRFTSPPKLVSGPTVTVAPTSITVKWATDRAASSFVQIKDGNTFVSEQGQTDQTTSHEVKVVGLRSQRDYIYTIRSTDVDGNTLSGDEQRFTTANTPSVYDLNVSNITQATAIVNFKSTAVANFTLYYGPTADYGLTLSETSTSATTNHSLALADLKPGTTYYFRVRGEDADGNELRSENSFATLPLPVVSHFGIQPDADAPATTLTVSWQTNVPTSSTVRYAADGVTFHEQSSADLVTDHSVTITDLADKSKYTLYATGRDQFGNLAESDHVTFDTPTDTRPPKISDVIIESSNVGNASDRAQVAISWKTDEPATSQIEYDTGITGTEYTRKTTLDSTATTHHLVIISDLDPGKPYHVRLLSADPAGNLTKSSDTTVITGDVSRSALQIIVNTMQNLFGWMGKLIK